MSETVFFYTKTLGVNITGTGGQYHWNIQLYQVLPPRYIKSEEKELLRTEYPNVIRVIDTINGNFCTKKRRKNKSGSYKDAPFAYITQTIESQFILDCVCGGLAQEFPDAPLYTIHDAIFTTPKYANEVINKISSVSKDMFGVEVRIHLSHQNH